MGHLCCCSATSFSAELGVLGTAAWLCCHTRAWLIDIYVIPGYDCPSREMIGLWVLLDDWLKSVLRIVYVLGALRLCIYCTNNIAKVHFCSNYVCSELHCQDLWRSATELMQQWIDYLCTIEQRETRETRMSDRSAVCQWSSLVLANLLCEKARQCSGQDLSTVNHM